MGQVSAGRRQWRAFLPICLAALVAFGSHHASAVEGGTGTYMLGSRDISAGVVPKPGTYLNTEFTYLDASAPVISLGGIALARPEVDGYAFRISATHVFRPPILGGATSD